MSDRLPTTARAHHMDGLIASLGYRYALCTLDSFELYPANVKEQNAVLCRLRRFADEMPKHIAGGAGVILLGKPGTGKDHLLSALLKIAIVQHGFTVAWWDGLGLYAHARHAISQDGEFKLMNALTTPQIIGLSDPQPPKGELTNFQTSLIRDAIDRRYRAGKSTWVTTNLDSTEDAERVLTGPLLDRLKDASGQVYCDWPSYRERRKPTW